MESKSNNILVKSIVTITFILMVVVNGLANLLPLGGKTTGEISNAYPNLFAPAAITFAIWGVIYFLLLCYTLYQLGFFQKDKSPGRMALLKQVGLYFAISSLANTAWIFSWHYEVIPLSMLFMIVILLCLIKIVNILTKQNFSLREKFFIRLPFSVYFGWITVATIANATVWLVSIGWNGFGLPDAAWAIIMISVGAVIAISTILKNKDFAYGLVILWAYLGILIKHVSANGFDGRYPAVIGTVIVWMIVVAASEVYLFFSGKKENA